MKSPLVSVIVPTYNRRSTLKRALNSIFKQTYNNIEVIVVDGPSSDGTKQYVQNLDKQVTYVRNERLHGSSYARNQGIEKANGEYIAFLDADDEWLPHKIEFQVENIQSAEESVKVVYCKYYNKHYGLSCLSFPTKNFKSGDLYHEYLSGWFAGITSSLLIHASCFEECGAFDESLPYFEDYDLLLRLSQHYTIDYVDHPLFIKYTGRSDALSNDQDAQLEGIDMMLDKWGDEMERIHGPQGTTGFADRRKSKYYFWLSIDSITNEGRLTAIIRLRQYLVHEESLPRRRMMFFMCCFIGGDGVKDSIVKYYRLFSLCRKTKKTMYG